MEVKRNCIMKRLLISLILIVVGQHLCRHIFEMAGGSTRSSDDDDKPKTVGDLKKEHPNLPARVYEVFKAAVDHHNKGQLGLADSEYKKLTAIPLKSDPTKKIDLSKKSKVFKFNLELLDKQKKKQQKSS